MTSSIERVRAGQVEIGDRIAQVDDDSLETDAEINANYATEEQEWAEVTDKGGHADIGWLRVEFEDGETSRFTGDWDSWVWRLTGGRP